MIRSTFLLITAFMGLASPAAAQDVILSYGDHPRQAVDIYLPETPSADRPPLIVFVHGGAWQTGNRMRVTGQKPAHFNALGLPFASTGFRLLPEAPVEVQAADIGAALGTLRAEADALGFDPDRIVLMGHSSGAHLAALVASDPQYAGEHFDAIAAVVLLDVGAYDVPAALSGIPDDQPSVLRNVFGDTVGRQRALSPVTHAGGRDVPEWLIIHVSYRENTRQQSHLLADALRAEGSNAQVVAISDTDHRRLQTEIGTPGDLATQHIDRFIAALID